MEVNCLFIQGLSGTGKTTLAKRLSERLLWAHLDRDDIEENGDSRDEVYKNMQRQLRDLLRQGESVIVDAPFFYEGEEEFAAWVGGLDSIKDVPKPNFKVIQLALPVRERMRRRRMRDLQRDQVSDWEGLLNYEDRLQKVLPSALEIPSSLPPETQEEIVLWHLEAEGRSVRPAGPQDLEQVYQVKRDVLKKSFASFLYEDELALEMQQVTGRKEVLKMIKENEVLLASQKDQPWAIAAISAHREKSSKTARKIFSAYSRGRFAGLALGLILVAQARGDGEKCVMADVYRDNERSKKALGAVGFVPDGSFHINKLVPRVPVEHWRKDLA